MKKTVKRLLIIMLTVLFVFTNCVGTNMTVSAASKKPTKITLNYQKKNMSVGETLSLNISKIKPANASKSVKWSTSDKKIATVTASGKVKAKKTGTVTITATSKSNSKVVAKCKIKVYKAATKITLNYSKKSMYVGNSLTLKVKSVKPSGALKNITWKSSNSKVATVSASGKVSAKKLGTVTITATDKGNKKTKAKCKITITYKPTKTIKLNSENSYNLMVGEKVTLNAKVTNPKSGAQPIQWSSKDKTVAKVDSKGNVTAVSEGTTTIVAASGKKNVQVTITVYKDILVSTPTPAPTASPVPTAIPLPTVTPAPTTEPEPTVTPMPTTTPTPEEVGTYYSRAEWISVLNGKRGYAVTEENMAKDAETGELIYSYDDIYDNEYALDVEAAVQNAVLNCSAEENYRFLPNEDVTREFAAMTAVRTLGITTDSVLGCSDKDEITYASEVQAAIESGMFTLIDGAFKPDAKVTEEEFATILQIADEIIASWEIDLNHEDVIEYTDDVVEATTQMEDYTVSVSDGDLYVTLPESQDTGALEVGQIVLLPASEEYTEGLPIKIDSLIQENGNVIVEGHMPEEVTEVFEHVDIEGLGQFDIENIVLAEGVTFVEEDDSEVNLTNATGEGELPVNFNKKLEVVLNEVEGVGKEVAYISLEIPEIKYKLDFTKSEVKEVLVEIPNTIKAVYDVEAEWSGEKEIGKFPIKLPAGFSVDLVISVVVGVDGSIHLEYKLDNTFGVHYKAGKGIQKISKMNKSWEMELDANANLGINMSAQLNWMGGVKNKIADLFGNEEIGDPLYTVGTEVGVGVNANTIARSEQELVCTNASIFIYLDIFVGEDSILANIAPILEHRWNVFDKDNSPLKAEWHFENLKKVAVCTYKPTKFKILVVDENSKPIANAQLKIRENKVPRIFKTNASGVAEGSLVPGDYNCNIVVSGYKEYSDAITIKGGETSITITLASEKSDTESSGNVEYPDGDGDGDSGTGGDDDTGNGDDSGTGKDDESGDGDDSGTEGDDDTGEVTIPILYSGTWYGMDWTIDEEGNLVISGEYVGTQGSSDISWKNYAHKIITAKVTAKNITDMSSMFYDCVELRSVDFSGVDTSQVTDMYAMFAGCSGLSSIDLEGLDTSNVTSMEGMFAGCSGLSSIDLKDLDTSKVTSMGSMFVQCSNLESVDLSGLNASRVISMGRMFWECSSLKNVNLKGIDTSCAKYMDSMFLGCNSLESIDISELDTSQVSSMTSMFSGCSSLSSIDMSELDISQASGMMFMFENCSSLTDIDLSGLNISRVNSMAHMFAGCSSLLSVNLSGVDASRLTGMGNMFKNCSSLNSIDLSGMVTNRVDDVVSMFEGCSSLRSIDLSGLKVSNSSYIRDMFPGCSSLSSIVVPINLTKEVELPSGTWKDASGTIYTYLPMNVTESFVITKEVEE